jgi:transketolase
MAQPVTVTVILKGDERTYRQKFLHYGSNQPKEHDLFTNTADPHLQEMVREARSNFQGEPQDIAIRCEFQWA